MVDGVRHARAATWESVFVATSLVLGESEEAIAKALGRSIRLPTSKDERARLIATAIERVANDLADAEAKPWRT
jgi:hypothetical protein